MSLNNANFTICRVCMTENGTLKSIFSLEDFSERPFKISEVITTCASVQVELCDGLPQEICVECLMRLRDAYSFKTLCEETDNTLRNHFMVDVKLEIDELVEQVNICTTSAEGQKVTKKRRIAKSAAERTRAYRARKKLREGANLEKPPAKSAAERMREYRARKKTFLGKNSKNGARKEILHDVEESQNLHAQQNEFNIEFRKYGEEVNIKLESEDVSVEDASITGNIVKEECFNSSLTEIKQEHVCREDNHEISTSTQLIEMQQKCGKSLATKQNLCTHRNINKCDICNESCADKHHKRIHSDEKPHMCDVCGTCFSTKSNLDRHKKHTHGPVKLHGCCVCRKYFTDKAVLRLHRDAHTSADKTHGCLRCDRRFYSGSKLRRHVRIAHEGEKPHGCLVCGAHFSTPQNLRKHTKRHTGEKILGCDVCGKFFTLNKTLMEHKKRHAANKLKEDSQLS